MLTASEVVMFLLTCMTAETSFGCLFWRLVLEGNDLCGIPFFAVGLAWSVARFAASCFAFPTANLGKFRMRGVREGFELILVAVFAGFTTDIIFGDVSCWFGLARFGG